MEHKQPLKLGCDFYAAHAEELAPLLLGKFLCQSGTCGVLKKRITETECYCGETDTACHARRGRTKRTEVMYHSGGTVYVYLCYGIHYMFNIVAGPPDYPEAVLIRGVEGSAGPGLLTKAFGIDLRLNGEDLSESKAFWLEDDGFSPVYKTGKRIGIASATEEYRDKLWRFTAAPV
jgi:DNA-3-methyladenine glycosylase